jgi:hypothetical protein
VTWLTWRQFRAQAAAVYGLVGAFAVVLAVTGPRLADLGGDVFDQLTRTDRGLFFTGIVVMALAPAIVGAFWGAPLVAREIEAGTHRLVWSQGTTRTRWLAVKLGVLAGAAAAGIGLLSFAVTWWSEPLDGALSATRGSLPSRLTPVSFAMRGITPAAYALFAVLLGVAAGMLLRRSVPAMALTLAVFAAVQIAMPLWVRPHLIPPVTETVAIGTDTLDGIGISGSGTPVVRLTVHTADPGDWVLSDNTIDSAGRAVGTLPSWFLDCVPPPPSPGAAETTGGVAKAPDIKGCLDRLSAEGYQQQVVYQPAGRFWSLQWVETGVFLGLSGLLAWFCFRRVRHLS